MLHTLPQALCSICSVIYLGGTFSVEEYRPELPPYLWGYRFSWEEADAPRTHLIAMIICQRERLTTGRLLRMQPDILTTPVGHARGVLAWLEMLCHPDGVVSGYKDEECQCLGQHVPLRPAADGTPRIWRGYSWIQACPPLHGDVLLSLAGAFQPQATYAFSRLFASWKLLARVSYPMSKLRGLRLTSLCQWNRGGHDRSADVWELPIRRT